jgi:hypothetical protein
MHLQWIRKTMEALTEIVLQPSSEPFISYHLNQPVKQGKQNDLKTPRPQENLRTYPLQWPPCTVIYLRYRSVSVLSDQTPCDYNFTSVTSSPLFMKSVERNAVEWHNQALEDNNQATTNMLTCHRQVKFWKLENTNIYTKYNDSYGQMNFVKVVNRLNMCFLSPDTDTNLNTSSFWVMKGYVISDKTSGFWHHAESQVGNWHFKCVASVFKGKSYAQADKVMDSLSGHNSPP